MNPNEIDWLINKGKTKNKRGPDVLKTSCEFYELVVEELLLLELVSCCKIDAIALACCDSFEICCSAAANFVRNDSS